MNIKTTKDNATTSSLQCDVTLLPIEIFFRQRTISNLSTFAAHLKEEPAKPESTKLNSIQNDDLDDKASKQISFCCHCPSVTFSIPLLKEVTTGPLFDRCGEVLENARITGASVGVLIDNTSFEWTETKNDEIDSNELESSGNFSCHHLLFFAKSPIGDKITVDTKMQRTDICVARGRMEVNPYIPISIDFRKNSPGRKEGNHGRHSFPLVPAISSFKARQEDEDEELKIDRLLFSKLQDVDADSRKELRGSDPQIAMVADAEMCNSVVVLNIPEILSDLTKTEIETFLMMLDAARPTPEAFDSSNTSRSTDVALPISEEEAEAKSLCISISIDQITLSLKEDLYIEGLFGKREQFSCLAALDTFKAHILLGNSGLKHLRLLAHEPCLYAGKLSRQCFCGQPLFVS